MNPPTVADELLIASLPDDLRAAIERVYGAAPGADILAEVYRRGFEDACDEMTFETPTCSKMEARRAVESIMQEKRMRPIRGAAA